MPNPNNLRAGIESQKPDLSLVSFDVYQAEFDAVVFGTNGALTNVNIDTKADFLIQQMTLSVIDTVTGLMIAVPWSLVQLVDTSSQGSLFRSPTHPLNLFEIGRAHV